MNNSQADINARYAKAKGAADQEYEYLKDLFYDLSKQGNERLLPIISDAITVSSMSAEHKLIALKVLRVFIVRMSEDINLRGGE